MIKLYKGDCLEVMKDIPDKSIDMILCDLPYGTTACKWDIVIPFDKLWEQYNRLIKDNGAIVLFGSEPFSSKLRMSNLKNYRYDWIWEKSLGANPLLCKKQPMKYHENISVFYKKQSTYNPQMTRGKMRNKKPVTWGNKKDEIYNGSLSSFNGKDNVNDLYYPRSYQYFSNANQKEKLHPTQKPVALLEYLIKTYTNENETVLDNCMGSGSTGVACINTNRNFIGIELNDNYFEIAKKRIEEE
jgi:site-specific DNA-methyltransferase (adenine-specific)